MQGGQHVDSFRAGSTNLPAWSAAPCRRCSRRSHVLCAATYLGLQPQRAKLDSTRSLVTLAPTVAACADVPLPDRVTTVLAREQRADRDTSSTLRRDLDDPVERALSLCYIYTASQYTHAPAPHPANKTKAPATARIAPTTKRGSRCDGFGDIVHATSSSIRFSEGP